MCIMIVLTLVIKNHQKVVLLHTKISLKGTLMNKYKDIFNVMLILPIILSTVEP